MHMVGIFGRCTYGGYISWMIYFCTWLMYMGVVHGGNILVHDVLGGYIVHDSLFSLMTYLLFHDVWYGTSLMHEQVQGLSYGSILLILQRR